MWMQPSQQYQEHMKPPEGSRRLDQPHCPDRRQLGSSAGLQLQASLGALCCNFCPAWNHLLCLH